MDFKKILPIAIIAAAVLSLVVYAAFIAPANNAASTVGQAPATGSAGTGNVGQTPQMPPQTTPTVKNEPVSSKEPATIVPEGTDLKQYCEQYYAAWNSGDWQTAFKLQPYAKQQNGDANSLAQQLQGYGMVGYKIGEPKIDKNVGTLAVNLDLGQNGIWTTTWTFVKNDKGQWTVQDSKTSMVGGE